MSVLDDFKMALRRLLTVPGDALTLVLVIATGITISALGLRLAIGAPPTRLLADSLQDSGRSALLGVLLGSGLAVLVLRGLGAQLHGVDAFSAPVLGFGAGVLLLTSLLAALPPALRAMRLDLVIALRSR